MSAREADEVLVSADASKTGRVFITVVHGRYETALNVSAGELVRLRAVIDAHLSTPPADDVREACQRPTVGWHCSREAGHDGPCAARPIGQHDHKWVMSEGWAKCALCGLEDEDPQWQPSSPPDDVDVREALRDIVRGGSYSRFPDELPYADVVDRILAAFEVRPRGTVTDAEVEAAPMPCGKGVPGTVPSWAGDDQIDPCDCVRPAGHEGPHACAHENASDAVEAAGEGRS